MKHISKGAQPQSFTNWKAQATANVGRNWSDFQDPVKNDVARALLQEQGELCCYCMGQVYPSTAMSGGNCHIEHIKPKGRPEFAHLQLEYNNFAVSCGPAGRRGQPEHCGAAKGDKYPPGFVSPHVGACESLFSYSLSGEVEPNSPVATSMLDVLNLNSDDLVQARKQVITEFARYTLRLRQTGKHKEVKTLVARLRARRRDGRFSPYCLAVEHVAKNTFHI